MENRETETIANRDIAHLEGAIDIKDEKKYYTVDCGKCENKFETSRKYELIQQSLKHKETCASTKQDKYKHKKYCERCDFVAKNETLLKRHKRDNHDLLSASTSPPPKKTKISQGGIQCSEEKMEIEETGQEDM